MTDKDLRHLLENLFSDLPLEEIHPPVGYEESAAGPTGGLLASALRAITDGVIITDADGTVLYSNPASEQFTGYGPKELIGRSLDDLWNGSELDSPYQEIRQSLRSGQAWSGELPNRLKDGAVLAVETRSTEILHRDQKAWIHIIRDSMEGEPAKTKRPKSLDAIENTYIFRHSTRQATVLEVINKVSQAVASALKLDDLMQAIHQQVSRLFDTTNFYIATYREGSDQWHSEFHLEGGQRQDSAWYSIKAGLTGYIIRNRAPLLFRSEQEIISFHKEQGMPLIGDAALSWLGVPLISGEKVVGVMAIQDYSQENLYNDQDLALFDTIASQVAAALDSLRLLQETQRRAHELEVISQVGGAITSVLDLDTVLHQISDTIKSQFGHYFVGISLLEEDQLVFHGGSTIGQSTSRLDLPDLGLSGGPSLVASVAVTGEPVVVDDVLEDPNYLPIALLPETRSELDVPIKIKGQIIGVLDVQSARPGAFSPSDVALLQSIANQAGIAIDNARLYEQSQLARAEAEELYLVSAALSSVQTYDDVLAILCDNSLLAHAKEVTVSLFDRPWREDQVPRWFEDVARRGATGTESDRRRREIEVLGWIGHLLESSSPILIENMQTDPRIDPESRTKLVHERGYKGAILIPMIVGGQRIGIVESYFPEIAAFPLSPLRRLTALAGQAAVSIQGIRQYEEIERRAIREQALRQIAETIGTAEEVEEFLPNIAQYLRSLVALDLFELSTFTPGEPEFRRFSYDLTDDNTSVNWVPLEGSLAAWVTAEGEPRLDLDLRTDKVFAEDDDWLAAGQRSRVTIPLQIQELTLGVLSLYSKQRGAFSVHEMPTLIQVGDQIALALERTYLLEETRAALSRAEASYQRYLSDEWRRYLSETSQSQGYLSSHDALTEESQFWTPEIERALAEESTVLWQESVENGESFRSAIALPIRLRGQTIGVLDFYQEGQEREWSEDEKALVEALADQIALALENARLYEEAERRAHREATIGQIATQVRQQPDIDAVLRTAVRELGKALGTSRTFVRLSNPVEEIAEPGELAGRGEL
jgi:PAS domain S-box-containing protein